MSRSLQEDGVLSKPPSDEPGRNARPAWPVHSKPVTGLPKPQKLPVSDDWLNNLSVVDPPKMGDPEEQTE